MLPPNSFLAPFTFVPSFYPPQNNLGSLTPPTPPILYPGTFHFSPRPWFQGPHGGPFPPTHSFLAPPPQRWWC